MNMNELIADEGTRLQFDAGVGLIANRLGTTISSRHRNAMNSGRHTAICLFFMPKLNQVFGISNAVPQYTYVDRSGLDNTFAYSLGSDRHIVLHGGSKQGKTVLRRKNLPEDRSIVVQCSATTVCAELYGQILAALARRSRPNIIEHKIFDVWRSEREGWLYVALFGKFRSEREGRKEL